MQLWWGNIPFGRARQTHIISEGHLSSGYAPTPTRPLEGILHAANTLQHLDGLWLPLQDSTGKSILSALHSCL